VNEPSTQDYVKSPTPTASQRLPLQVLPPFVLFSSRLISVFYHRDWHRNVAILLLQFSDDTTYY
jgi:hypothetical protein